jgi:hypothetical protein
LFPEFFNIISNYWPGLPSSFLFDKKKMDCYILNMSSLNQILQEASHLPEDQRLTLVHRLLIIGEAPPSENIKHLWDVEIQDRITRYDRGEIRSRPAGEVFSELDRRLRR